jgi:hypothetical protein
MDGHESPALRSYVVDSRIGEVWDPLRHALADMELEVIGTVNAPEHSRVLLVDCPLLDFEALALDRASAVFFPVHILVSPWGGRTRVSVMDPASLFDARFPVGMAEPMERLLARIALAVELMQERFYAAISLN